MYFLKVKKKKKKEREKKNGINLESTLRFPLLVMFTFVFLYFLESIKLPELYSTASD